MTVKGITILGTTPVVFSIAVAIASFVIASLLGKPSDKETLKLFFS
jgi:hypothetical protein